MFKQMRRRLTWRYTAVFFCLLLSFAAITLGSAVWVIWYELKQEVRLVAHEEAEEQLALHRVRGRFGDEEGEPGGPAGIFYYVLDEEGQVVAEAAPPEPLHSLLRGGLPDWLPAGETRILRLRTPAEERLSVLLTAEPLLEGERQLGTVYLGRDISAYYRLLRWVVAATLTVLACFLAVAAWAGYFLAGRAMRTVEQSFARQREFTADASHELRTPLSVLLASVEALQGDRHSALSPFSRQVLADMKDEIKKMSRLVADLLTLARADGGAEELRKETFDLQQLAQKVVRQLLPLAQERQLQLELLAPEPLRVQGDYQRLQQLLLLLLDNALQYTPAGGRVRLVLAWAEEAEGTVRLAVEDTGIGLTPEEQGKIFQRFYRADKARSRAAGGSGLGLAIARWIVVAHGGALTVASAPGQGSTFVALLPLGER